MPPDQMTGVSAYWVIVGIVVTVMATLLGAIIKATRAWSRLEGDLRVLIRDFESHMATERAERMEIVTRHTHDIESIEARLTLAERELVRLGGWGTGARPT